MEKYFKSEEEAQKYIQTLFDKMFPAEEQDYFQWLFSYFEELNEFHKSYIRKLLQQTQKSSNIKELYQNIINNNLPNDLSDKQKTLIINHFNNRLILEQQVWFQKWWKRQPFKYKTIWRLHLDGYTWRSIQRKVSETDHKKITGIFDRMLKEIQRQAPKRD